MATNSVKMKKRKAPSTTLSYGHQHIGSKIGVDRSMWWHYDRKDIYSWSFKYNRFRKIWRKKPWALLPQNSQGTWLPVFKSTDLAHQKGNIIKWWYHV